LKFKLEFQHFRNAGRFIVLIFLINNTVQSLKTDKESLYQEFSQSKIEGLLQDLLNDTRVNYLKIRSERKRGNLKKIDAETFKNLVELVELEVSHHKVENIDKKAFEQNVDLMKIDFSDNEITDFDPELFKNLPQLREVNFQQNRLKDLPENLFEKNVHLLVINFAHNEIQKIPFKLFDKLKNLEEIYLNDNQIKSISNRFFKKKNLWNVQLNNNEIKKIRVSRCVTKIKNCSGFMRVHRILKVWSILSSKIIISSK
jgi:Leucine-rich repeat (LRR) protein